MAQRGRKSAATIAALAQVQTLKRRLPPPDDLPPLEAQIWTKTMNSFAVGWFESSDIELLRAYVGACAQHLRFQDEAEGQRAVVTGAQGGPIANPIFGMIDRERNTIARLAVKLRISKSSRIDPKTAATNSKAAGTLGADGERSTPWQRSA